MSQSRTQSNHAVEKDDVNAPHSLSESSRSNRPSGEGEVFSGRLPWADDQRAGDKTQFALYVAQGDIEVTIPEVLDGTVGATENSKNWRLAKRFFRKYDKWFNTVDISGASGGFTQSEQVGRTKFLVSPTNRLKSLLQNIALDYGKEFSQRTYESFSPALSRGEFRDLEESEHAEDDEEDEDDDEEFALDRARGVITKTKMLQGPGVCRGLGFNLSSHLDANEVGKAKMPEKRFNNRYNDRSEAGKIYATGMTKLENAADAYDCGIQLDLTTNPFVEDESGEYVYDGIDDMHGALMDAKEAILKKIGYEAHGKSLPPHHVDFLEFTDTGIPHMHIEVFGVTSDSLPSKKQLKEYAWETLDHCKELEIRNIEERNGEWWYQESGTPVTPYVLKSVKTLLDVAEGKICPGDNPFHYVNKTKMNPWKLSLYWAVGDGNGRQFVYGSYALDSPLEDGRKFNRPSEATETAPDKPEHDGLRHRGRCEHTQADKPTTSQSNRNCRNGSAQNSLRSHLHLFWTHFVLKLVLQIYQRVTAHPASAIREDT